ncbi:hypothetical protein Aph02nite_12870 [Actinoplanes philippinensis]|uniref:Lipoprotein LprG n=1 Tax=Actinoplanes philippinensis TaxID=35752 RepID=A0A1I1ZR41_9ACTN|nr:hypothetical protein [Actinoplanes philippinensis]GIE75337.1 hypothetical protein Aph02nite_12870 [Actinoplanes philippinensis]SFE34157.1 hypothetical protein SAMN05421541_101252 [Actinoplanes philippinensis]
MTTTILRAGLTALATATVLLSGCTGSGNAAPPAATPPASPSPTGNGFATMTADEIMTKALEASAAARSYHVKGTSAADEEMGAVTMDIRVAGDDLAGRITIDGTAEMELLAVGGKQYFKGNEAFLVSALGAEKARTMMARAGGKWVAVAGKDDLSGMFGIADIKKELSPKGLPIKGAVTQVEGTPAIILSDNLSDLQIFVAMTGEPYPLQVLSPGAGERFTYSEYGATFPEITAPAADQVANP